MLTLENRSCDPFVVGDAKEFALHSQSRVADEFPRLFVPKKDTCPIAPQKTGGRLRDVLQEPIEILMRMPIGGDLKDLT